MNRAARRKAMKNKSQIADNIHFEIQEEKKRILKRAVHDLTAAFILSLADEFGFGKKRIERLLYRVNRQFECINEGYVTINDIKKMCQEIGLDYEVIFNGK